MYLQNCYDKMHGLKIFPQVQCEYTFTSRKNHDVRRCTQHTRQVTQLLTILENRFTTCACSEVRFHKIPLSKSFELIRILLRDYADNRYNEGLGV